MACPCPCEVIVNESLSNDPPGSLMDPTSNVLIDDDNAADDLDRYAAAVAATYQPGISADHLQHLAELHELFQQRKSLDSNRKRFKRPSWATIGKRTSQVIHKRPAWARVG